MCAKVVAPSGSIDLSFSARESTKLLSVRGGNRGGGGGYSGFQMTGMIEEFFGV